MVACVSDPHATENADLDLSSIRLASTSTVTSNTYADLHLASTSHPVELDLDRDLARRPAPAWT